MLIILLVIYADSSVSIFFEYIVVVMPVVANLLDDTKSINPIDVVPIPLLVEFVLVLINFKS